MNIYKITRFRNLKSKLETITTEYCLSLKSELDLLDIINKKIGGTLVKFDNTVDCYIDSDNEEWYPNITDNKKFMKKYGNKHIIFDKKKVYGDDVLIIECVIENSINDYSELIEHNIIECL